MSEMGESRKEKRLTAGWALGSVGWGEWCSTQPTVFSAARLFSIHPQEEFAYPKHAIKLNLFSDIWSDNRRSKGQLTSVVINKWLLSIKSD